MPPRRECQYFNVSYNNIIFIKREDLFKKSSKYIEKNVTLKAGASKKIIVKAVLNNAKGTLLKHTAELVYSTSNSKVATVSKAGVITAVGKGSCTIYVRAENGVFTTVTVTVK